MSVAHSTNIAAHTARLLADGEAEYRTIERFPGYRFGSDGSVWTRWQGTRVRFQTDTWRRINGCLSNGYPEVYLRADGERAGRGYRTHRLILEAFVGPCPVGMEGCHNDSNPLNCNLDNLRWDTKAGNDADKVHRGTILRGSGVRNAKLNEEKVLEIRRLWAKGGKLKDLAAAYGVTDRLIRYICRNHIWKHVPAA